MPEMNDEQPVEVEEEAQKDNRPVWMHRNGREAQQTFNPTDRLYYCVRPMHYEFSEDNGFRVLPAGVRPPDQSTNRVGSNMGVPEDVLWDEKPGVFRGDQAIVSVEIQNLPQEVQGEGGQVAYRTKPQHAPLNTNYAHTEIISISKDSRTDEKCRINHKATQAVYRELIAKASCKHKLPPHSEDYKTGIDINCVQIGESG